MFYVQFHMLNTHSKKIVLILDLQLNYLNLPHAAFITCFQVVKYFCGPGCLFSDDILLSGLLKKSDLQLEWVALKPILHILIPIGCT